MLATTSEKNTRIALLGWRLGRQRHPTTSNTNQLRHERSSSSDPSPRGSRFRGGTGGRWSARRAASFAR